MPFGWPLSWPTTLPTLSSLRGLSLFAGTSQWQRRLLLYLVRRSLAGILLLPEDDIEQSIFLTADLSSGSVRLKQLKLDAKSLNERIKNVADDYGLDISIQSGTIGSVELVLGDSTIGHRIHSEGRSDQASAASTSTGSATDRLFNAPIQLAVDGVSLVIHARPKQPRQDKGKSASLPIEDALTDLEASILHVAQDYLHESVLLDSAAPPEDEDDPFSLPGGFASSSSTPLSKEQEKESVGLISTIVERLLARLQVKIKNVQVKLILESAANEVDAVLELRVEKVESATKVQESSKGTSLVRTLEIVQPEIWMRIPTGSNEQVQARRSSSDGTDTPGKAKTPDSEDDMAMSMAIADLRQSDSSVRPSAFDAQGTYTGEDGDGDSEHEEMYFSTLAGQATEGRSRIGFSSQSIPSRIQPKEEPPDEEKVEDAMKMVFGLFPVSSDVSPKAAISVRFTLSTASPTGSNPKASTGEQGRLVNPPPFKQLEITLPVIGIRIEPSQILTLLKWSHRLAISSDPSAPSTSPTTSQSSILMHLKLNAAHFYLDMAPSAEPLQSCMAGTATGRVLHVFVEGIEGAHRSSISDRKLVVRSHGLVLREDEHVMPLLLPDPGIAWSYPDGNLLPGQQIVSKGDWRSRPKTTNIQDWQTSVPANSSSRKIDTTVPILNDAVAMRVRGGDTTVVLQPAHIWLDFEVLERLLPLLDLVNQVSAMREDIIGESSARSTTQGEVPLKTIKISTTLVRLDMRCPNPVTKELRSGVLMVDIWDVVYTQVAEATPNPRTSQPRKMATFASSLEDPPLPTSQLVTSFRRLDILLSKAGQSRKRTCLLSISGSSPEISPTIQLLRQSSTGNAQAVSILQVALPSLQIALDKPAIDGLQYLADDIGQYAAYLSNQSTVSAGRNENAQAQSQGGISHQSSSGHTSSARTSVGLSVRVEIIQATLSLDIPSTTLQDSRKLVLKAGEISIVTGLPSDTSTGVHLAIIARSGEMSDTSSSATRIIARRLAQEGSIPLLSLDLTSRVNLETSGKQLIIKATLHSLLLNATSDTTFIADLLAALQAPPGAFVNVEAGELTQMDLLLQESMIRMLPRTHSSAVALQVKELRCSTAIRNGQDVHKSLLSGHGLEVWLAAESSARPEGEASLRSLGYASLAHVEALHVQIEQRIQYTDLNVDQMKASITVCPDTLLVLSALLADFSPPPIPKAKPAQKPMADLSGSIIMPRSEQTGAAGRSQPPTSPGKIVSQAKGEVITVFGEGKIDIKQDWFAKPRTIPRATSTVSDTILNVRLQKSVLTISLFEGYDFEKTRKHVKNAVKATRRKLEKIRQLLAEGQMPEETVDEAADYLLQSVFLPPRRPSADGSDAREDLNTMDRIIAFDDELDQEEDDHSQSWEDLPDPPPAMRRTFSSSSAKPMLASTSRLKRPKQSALDVQLGDLELRFNAYQPDNALASRLAINVGHLNIVDNMKSSTWHKFLTELRPRDGGICRPTDAPMVRVLLKMLRRETSEGEEATLKAQVPPLRLHVDQDALDFLKAFAAFKIEEPVPPDIATAPAQQKIDTTSDTGFIQRVEVLSIKIKLDYKPKRVDYRALQKGQTIEMMNFFHFEASEMVLRHLVLTGVPSWARVGEMCQDIWTPDVKSNQLADFLAGINPVRSVVNVGGGVADLVLLPVQQYRKDGRLGRGVQKGTSKFAKTTALEAVKLGARLASGTQVILERAEHFMGGRDSGVQGSSNDLVLEATDDEDMEDYGRTEALSKFAHQPTNAKEGIQSAYRSLSGNVKSAAETILAVPMEVYERSSEGPVRAVVRAVPVAVLRSGIGASQAVRETLLGLRNQMDPGAKEEIQDKYKRPSTSS